MLIRKTDPARIRPSEITPETVYQGRRRFLKKAAGAGLATGAGLAVPPLMPVGTNPFSGFSLIGNAHAASGATGKILDGVVKSKWRVDDEPTPFDAVAGYNNYYEFTTSKDAVAKKARDFRANPWTLQIAGEAEKTGTFNLEDILKPHTLEERIYRLRCVEAWSMVVPWVGVPLGDVLKRFNPTSKAKFVAFETLYDPEQMPGQRWPSLKWPYDEGLRMDEAMHPLALLVVGLYGRELPNQNGAPLRLMVPWKYGFKSIKSIVRITFTEKMPPTAWNRSAPREYGFYANVNPEVDHPRWSQASERRVGDFLRRPTLPFNGYADEVASLYQGMDLTKFY